MADEPKPPDPAPGTPPASGPAPAPASSPAPAPAAAAPAAPASPAAKGPPQKMIIMGCGGLAVIVVLILLIKMVAGGGGLSTPGVSADLKTPESAAKSFETWDEERDLIQREDSYSRRGKDLDEMRERLPWMADKAEYEKEIKRSEAWTEAYGKHRSELKKYSVDVVDVKDSDGLKAVKVKVTGKQLQPDGDNWKLADRTEEKVHYLTQIEGKWKLKK
jgi:hypothetical protein